VKVARRRTRLSFMFFGRLGAFLFRIDFQRSLDLFGLGFIVTLLTTGKVVKPYRAEMSLSRSSKVISMSEERRGGDIQPRVCRFRRDLCVDAARWGDTAPYRPRQTLPLQPKENWRAGRRTAEKEIGTNNRKWVSDVTPNSNRQIFRALQ